MVNEQRTQAIESLTMENIQAYLTNPNCDIHTENPDRLYFACRYLAERSLQHMENERGTANVN